MDMNEMGLGCGIKGPSPPQSGSVKKKRRTNTPRATAAAAAAMQNMKNMQDFGPVPMMPPPLSGFGDTVVANNPFDDTPQRNFEYSIQNMPPQLHPPGPSMGMQQMRGMAPMQPSSMNPMMGEPVPRICGPGPVPPMNQMGPPMGNVDVMNAMRPMMRGTPNAPRNLNQPGIINVGPMNPQMNILPGNNPLFGMKDNPRSNAGGISIGRGLENPMGGPMGPRMSSTAPSHMNINVPPMNVVSGPRPQNIPQQQPNPMSTIRAALSRPQSLPINIMGPPMTGGMMSLNQMSQFNMMRAPMRNYPNNNMNQPNQFGVIGDPVESDFPSNGSGKFPKMCNSILQNELQHPSVLSSKSTSMVAFSEKIYPPGQPLVFNRQNPLAPLISVCGVCQKEVRVNDQAILCESGCSFWFHRVCSGLSPQAYDLLLRELCAEWACDKCLQTKNVAPVKFKS